MVSKAFPTIGVQERDTEANFARALSPELGRHTLASRALKLDDALQTALAHENASKIGDVDMVNRTTKHAPRIMQLAEQVSKTASAVYMTKNNDHSRHLLNKS